MVNDIKADNENKSEEGDPDKEHELGEGVSMRLSAATETRTTAREREDKRVLLSTWRCTSIKDCVRDPIRPRTSEMVKRDRILAVLPTVVRHPYSRTSMELQLSFREDQHRVRFTCRRHPCFLCFF